MVFEKDIIKDCYLDKIKNEWLDSKDSFPTFVTAICHTTKIENELYIQTVSDDFRKQLNNFPRIPIGQKKWKQKTLNMFQNMLTTETIIYVHNFMNQQTLQLLQDDLMEFLQHVRSFAPELSIDGIGQAIRNYIVYAMFVELHHIDHSFNNACFGYSMLYPFTDNYIDSNEYSDIEKKQYNQIIRDKIQNKEVHPKSTHQQKTCELLQIIESDYSRETNPTIYTLLLMMLEAQENSLLQQSKNSILSANERLDISLYKGSISVLIDGYLVKKELTENDLLFYLEFGFFLQLADDLRDIKEDSIKGNQTIFTIDYQFEEQEKIVNKMLHFVHGIMYSYHPDNDLFKEFILSNCYQLIYSSVTESREFFSNDYLNNLEQYLPVTCSFLDNIKHNQPQNTRTSTKDNYIKILDTLIF